MSLSVVVIDPSDESEIDYTDEFRPDLEFEIGGEAFNGDTDSGGTFRLEDLGGVISNRNDLAHGRRLIIREDASGVSKPLHIGRISPRTQQREMGHVAHRDRTITVTTRDSNADLSGIVVDQYDRPAEEPFERVLAVLAAYLNGSASTEENGDPDSSNGLWARNSTVIGDAFVNTTPLGFDMPAQTYSETDPRAIIRECCEWSGYDAFVIVNDDESLDLFFDEITSTAYTSTLSVSDNSAHIDSDTFAPKWDLGAAHELDGSEQASGILLIGANERRTYGSFGATVEDVNDKWEYVERSEATAQADLNNNLVALKNARREEELRIQFSIHVPAEQAHLIRPGMRMELKRAYAAGIGSPTYFRAVQVRYSYEDPGLYYWIHIVLGFPVKRVRRFGQGRTIPTPPAEGTEGGCTRLYFSTDPGAVSPATSASWDDDDSGGSIHTLKTTADGTYAANHSASTSIGGGVGGRDVCMWRGAYGPIDATLAAAIAAGQVEFRAQIRARMRFGIGISESSQHAISQETVRITQGASTTIRGTALQLHSALSVSGAAEWPAQATKINRVFPPAGQTHEMAAVGGTQAGDYIIVEVGKRDFTTVTGGAAIALTNTEATDLPEDDLEADARNSWVELCTSGSTGDTTQPIVNPGEESTGTPGCTTYACNDHTHAHGLLADDGIHQHDADQIAGLTDPLIEGFVKTTDGGQHELNTVPSSGSAVTLDLADGNVHDVTLDADCTFAFSGATSGVECRFRLLMRQDATGGWAPTFPASVVWPDDTEPTWSTDPEVTDIVEFLSIDGGTTWHGDAGGSSGTGGVSLSDASPLVEAGAGSPGVGTEASRDDHVHPAAASGGGIGQILIADSHSTPLVFADLLQTEAGDDLLYDSP